MNSIAAASVHNLVALFLLRNVPPASQQRLAPHSLSARSLLNLIQVPPAPREPLRLQRAVRLLLRRHPAASLG
jgi:hypothetical protein